MLDRATRPAHSNACMQSGEMAGVSGVVAQLALPARGTAGGRRVACALTWLGPKQPTSDAPGTSSSCGAAREQRGRAGVGGMSRALRIAQSACAQASAAVEHSSEAWRAYVEGCRQRGAADLGSNVRQAAAHGGVAGGDGGSRHCKRAVRAAGRRVSARAGRHARHGDCCRRRRASTRPTCVGAPDQPHRRG